MRGGAQAHLLEADDGNYYIVKFRNNPQHRRILINESLAAEILTHLQITAPVHQIVHLSPAFLAANPEIHIQIGTHRVIVEPGWHFGSRHPGNPETMAIYDWIPDSILGRVANFEQFSAVLVFDQWVANGDGRQAVFFRARLNDWLNRSSISPRELGFVALMIDHGHAFNGPDWELTDSPITGLYPRWSVYKEIKALSDFEPWIKRIQSFPSEVLDKALRQLPPEWIANDFADLEKLLDSLLRRRRRIPELLEACRHVPGNPFPGWD